jgi:phospholipid-transporting ATPase
LIQIGGNDDLCALRGHVEMEHPNNLIDSFTGLLHCEQVGGAGRAAVGPANVVLRGCVLRSTEWMVGLVVNTGHDVKIMQSKMDAKVKSSNLDRKATKQIGGIIVLLLWVCLCGSIGQVIQNSAEHIKRHRYLDWGDLNPGQQWVLEFFYLLLLHASMVPVSLYVSMAMVRYVQGAFMNWDLDMYYAPLDAPAVVRTMTLNEELGQVSHIFSDKTGTLTCNNMNFRKMSINGVIYGQGITEIGRAAWKLLGKPVPPEVAEAEDTAAHLAVPHVAFYDPHYEHDVAAAASSSQRSQQGKSPPTSSTTPASPAATQRARILDFHRYIALCHEVVPERLEDGSIKLSAPNPDDEALVCAAAFFGYEFKDRREQLCLIQERDTGRLLEIPVLYTLPFTSARKRMSVIVRDVDGQVKVITKGADTMMFSRVEASQPADQQLKAKTEKDIDQFSLEGLRCLVLAAVVVEDRRFQDWSRRYDAASTNLAELEKRKNGQPNELDRLESEIEAGLRIVGATAIEDRLQEGVPECVEKLVQAGLKIWVLTGDKEETAINIAVACNLVLPAAYMKQVVINKNTAPDIDKAKAIFQDEITVSAALFLTWLFLLG